MYISEFVLSDEQVRSGKIIHNNLETSAIRVSPGNRGQFIDCVKNFVGADTPIYSTSDSGKN